MLEEEGLKGAATMEKAKKLKLARENRAEFASLDLSNIVDRTTRRGENVVCLKYSGISISSIDADISVIPFK